MSEITGDESYVVAVESGADTPGPTYQVALELCRAWRRSQVRITELEAENIKLRGGKG